MTTTSIRSYASPFLRTRSHTITFKRNRQGDRVNMYHAILAIFHHRARITIRNMLNMRISAPTLRVEVRLLLYLPILQIRLMRIMIHSIRQTSIPLKLCGPHYPILSKVIRRPITRRIRRSIKERTHAMFDRGLQIHLSRQSSIVSFLLLYLRTTLSLLHRSRLITASAPSLTIRASVQKVTRTITPIRIMTHIGRRILGIRPLRRIIMNGISFSRGYLCLPLLVSLVS